MTPSERGKLGSAAQRAKHTAEDFAKWGARRGGPRMGPDRCLRCDTPIKVGNKSHFCRKCQREKGLPELCKTFGIEARS